MHIWVMTEVRSAKSGKQPAVSLKPLIVRRECLNNHASEHLGTIHQAIQSVLLAMFGLSERTFV